ncbi:MAG: GDP-mannose 4,6-dehydratase [Methanocellales archaeon]|nr:GDP-mannose 4,6-dehydratase [Methanocellales archaeon]
MSGRVLITGATGFVGSHLIDYLLQMGDIVIFGTKRRRSDMANVQHNKNKISWIDMDITDSYSVYSALKFSEPDKIFHLAAQSFVPMSWNAPQEVFTTNAIGTVNLLESVRQLDLDPKIQIAGSSEEYGLVKSDEVPIIEDNLLRPLSPYGVSKVAQDLFAQQYYKSYGMKIIITRAFNHTGPRRGEVFVCSDFSKQIAEIEAGQREPIIHVGNLNAQRDFSDVRDIVRAYWLSLQKCKLGEVYNICSEKSRTIRSVLDLLLSMSKVNIQVRQDPKKMRPSDVEMLQGDCSKFKKQTGWEPEIPFEQTLEDLLNFWRERV